MRGAAAIGCACLLAAAAASAQPPPMELGEVPSGPGAIRGRVVHDSDPAGAAGVPVALYALTASGRAGVRSERTDSAGSFAFEGVSVDPAAVYLVGAHYAGVPFGARATFAEGELERSVELRISDPTDDASRVSVGAVRVRLERTDTGCRHLRLHETHELRNAGDRVVFVPAERRAAASPLFRAPLPPQALGFEASFASFHGGLELRGDEVLFWGPVYPGSQELEFSWALLAPGRQLAIARPLPGGAEQVEVTGRDPVRSPGLVLPATDGAKRSIAKTWRGGPIDPGGSLDLSVELPPAAEKASPLVVEQVRLVLELDDALLEVEELHRVSLPGETALPANPQRPWLCIPLPDGADELRLGADSLELGPAPDASGALAVTGPLPAGASSLSLAYRLSVDETPVTLTRRFTQQVPLVSVFVADTGLLAHSERLHRRRPVRTSDLGYAHLEGFQLEAGEPVTLTLAPLPAPRGLPASARAGFVLAAGAVAALFLVAPLRGSRAEREPARPAESEAALEREGLYAAIEDLDHDLETGKIDTADHARLRTELRARAAGLLRDERLAARARPAPQTTECVACGAPRRPDARFCSQCGARLPDPKAGSPA